MKLHHYLRPDLIILDLQAEGVEGTLQSLVHQLAESGLIEDEQSVFGALLKRETSQSTGIGAGVAIPHACYPGLDTTVMALALSRKGVDFRALDERPVHTFFLLLSPPAHSGTHIKLLARIARLIKHSGFMDQLLTASSSDEAIERIREFDEQHP